MCLACEGYSEEQIGRWLELTILTNGWALQGVEPPDPNDRGGGWIYSVGATENFGLPELVVVDQPTQLAGQVLNWALGLLCEGASLDHLAAKGVLWVPVHDRHLPSDLFASYTAHYRRPPESGQVLQLFPATREHSAECVRKNSTDLSDPDQLPASALGE